MFEVDRRSTWRRECRWNLWTMSATTSIPSSRMPSCSAVKARSASVAAAARETCSFQIERSRKNLA